MKKVLVRYCLVLVPLFLSAGEYGDAFIVSNTPPAIQALGHSTVARILDNGFAYSNPAGLYAVEKNYGNITYHRFGDLVTNYSLEAGIHLGERWVLGINYLHTGIDDIYERPSLNDLTPAMRRDSVITLAGSDLATLSDIEEAVFLSIATEYRFTIDLGWKYFTIPCVLPVGISAKYIDKTMADNRGIGSGLDLGSQLHFNLTDMNDLLRYTRFSLGLMLSDILNTPVYWTTEHQDAIKFRVVFGFSVTQSLPWIHTKLQYSSSTNAGYSENKQHGYSMNIYDTIILRAGNDGDLTSIGLGINIKKFIIDYTFSRHDLAGIQKVGVSYNF